jgi:transposase
MGTARRQYPDEFKQEALELLVSSGRPLSQIAEELGIPPERLRAWRYRSGGSKAGSPRRPNTQAAIPPAGVDLAAENARLRRENERLRMERDILKNRRGTRPPVGIETVVLYPGCGRERPSTFWWRVTP